MPDTSATPADDSVEAAPDVVPAEVLAQVAAAAAEDAGGLDPALLDDFLLAVCAAVAAGRRLSRRHTTRYEGIGEGAAGAGVALRSLLDLYLSAAWRLWRHLPPVRSAATDPGGVVTAGEVLLRAGDDAVAALAEGYQLARRQLVRREESDRREFVDDLLTGTADVPGLVQRAQRYGLDLAAPHAVVVVRAGAPYGEGTPVLSAVERRLQGRGVDSDALVATKDGALVVVFTAPDRDSVEVVRERLRAVLGPPGPDGGAGWRAGIGRPAVGAAGVVSSFEQARRVLDLGRRLRRPGTVAPPDAFADAADLLVFEVLLRDTAAAGDLVEAVLAPLRGVRGGAGPFLDTLETYFDTGDNATETARRLHLSTRAVTYRLARVRELTGVDPARSRDRFGLQAAVLAARALDWS